MTTLLYGVTPEPVDGALLPDGVRALAPPAGVAWVRTLAPHETPAALEQQRVLRAAMRGGRTPVPARAGSRFDDDAALVSALARSADTWRAALERVEGKVEMMVFLPLGDDVEPETAQSLAVSTEEHPGRAYLERLRGRLATGARAERWRDELRRALGDVAMDDAIVTHSSGSGVLVSHLVPRAREGDYRARVEAWRAACGASRAVVIGPWPPFSFAGDELR